MSGCVGWLFGLVAFLACVVWLTADPSGALFGLVGGLALLSAAGFVWGALGAIVDVLLHPRPTR